jgi:hypothetical protein
MSAPRSFYACCLISFVIIAFRFTPDTYRSIDQLKVTTWDAYGYYMYLPAIFIYQDVNRLQWAPVIQSQYNLQGNSFYQAHKAPNGSYVFKYLGGVALLQVPLFFCGHFLAHVLGFPTDGFSPPYQFSIAIGVIIYCIFCLFLLRNILLRFFDDKITALSLVLLMLASNIMQYISADGGMSHAFIFPLYVIMLWLTIRWHESPGKFIALMIGLVIGIATISRPTEAIMLFIPLLWKMSGNVSKWKFFKVHPSYLVFTGTGVLIGIFPQLIYWKSTAGTWVYDVGSKWDFASPHFKVLFGWEVGWFIYTPVALLFVTGLFFMKDFPFRIAVLTFCLINIYIIISWHEWKYGATYSCRALSQSYPVFALPLASLLQKIFYGWKKYLLYIAGCYLTGVNLFQLYQFNKTILHSRDMNRQYYSAIYLNPCPSPLDYSLLDSQEILRNVSGYAKEMICIANDIPVDIGVISRQVIIEKKTEFDPLRDNWIKVSVTVTPHASGPGSFFAIQLENKTSLKENRYRLMYPTAKIERPNKYEFFVKVPPEYSKAVLKAVLISGPPLKCDLNRLQIETYIK